MIRGFPGVVPRNAIEMGRFYLSLGYGSDPWLFQCIQSEEAVDGQYPKKALLFCIGDKPELLWTDIPSTGPFVALDDVYIRVDPMSVSATPFMTHPRRGMFLVDGDDPILCVPTDFRGWVNVDIGKGRVLNQPLGQGWLSFNRWSLVTDDEAGDELTITTFDGLTVE